MKFKLKKLEGENGENVSSEITADSATTYLSLILYNLRAKSFDISNADNLILQDLYFEILNFYVYDIRFKQKIYGSKNFKLWKLFMLRWAQLEKKKYKKNNSYKYFYRDISKFCNLYSGLIEWRTKFFLSPNLMKLSGRVSNPIKTGFNWAPA